jgi:hypothetical protein
VNLRLHFVISVINRGGSALSYAFFASEAIFDLPTTDTGPAVYTPSSPSTCLSQIPASSVIINKIRESILNESTKRFLLWTIHFH